MAHSAKRGDCTFKNLDWDNHTSRNHASLITTANLEANPVNVRNDQWSRWLLWTSLSEAWLMQPMIILAFQICKDKEEAIAKWQEFVIKWQLLSKEGLEILVLLLPHRKDLSQFHNYKVSSISRNHTFLASSMEIRETNPHFDITFPTIISFHEHYNKLSWYPFTSSLCWNFQCKQTSDRNRNSITIVMLLDIIHVQAIWWMGKITPRHRICTSLTCY